MRVTSHCTYNTPWNSPNDPLANANSLWASVRVSMSFLSARARGGTRVLLKGETRIPFHGRFVKIEFHGEPFLCISPLSLSLSSRTSRFHFVRHWRREDGETTRRHSRLWVASDELERIERSILFLLHTQQEKTTNEGESSSEKRKRNEGSVVVIFSVREDWEGGTLEGEKERRDPIRATFNKDHEKVRLRRFLFRISRISLAIPGDSPHL